METDPTDDGSAGRRRIPSRSQAVYARLRRDIGTLSLKPGTPLNETELGERYAASRTPVREALARLGREGFVERVGRQMRVRAFGFEEVQDLYQTREALEKMAVRLCIERASDDELHELRRQIDIYPDFDPETEYEKFVIHANQFHWTIARLSRNRTLVDMLMTVVDKVTLITDHYLTRPHSFRETQLEHSSILQAMYDRDVVVAEAAMRAHIQKVIRTYRDALRSSQGANEPSRDLGEPEVVGAMASWLKASPEEET